MTQMSVLSPPGGHRLRSVTRSYPPQQAPLLLHRALTRDLSASVQRSMCGAPASFLLKQHHTCDVSCTARTRRIRVFSAWGKHHRHSSQARGWPFTCHPSRSLFSSSSQKEEEDDRSKAKKNMTNLYFVVQANLALCFSASTSWEFFMCRKAMGLLVRAGGSAIAPPHPLSEKETRAFARELHTVNVGKA